VLVGRKREGSKIGNEGEAAGSLLLYLAGTFAVMRIASVVWHAKRRASFFPSE